MANKPHSSSDEPKKMSSGLVKTITGDFGESVKLGSGRLGTASKSRKEEPIALKKETQKSHSPEIVGDVSTSKIEESKTIILSTLLEELTLDLLKRITNDFSDEKKVGQDHFGTNYKAIRDGKAIVVQRLAKDTPVPREEVLIKEIVNITALCHDNIVKLVGYCTEPQMEDVKENGKYKGEETDESLLCYEYLAGGSLDKYIIGEFNVNQEKTDQPSNSDWEKRFKIIKGICDFLLYLHMEVHTIHMDLKPENVMLTDDMVAKIKGFGMSRTIGKQTHEKTKDVVGSYGYMAPEYYAEGEIYTWTDIYSLGVTIIEIVTMERNCQIPSQPSGRSFIDKVRENWTADQIVSAYPSEDASSLRQIKACIEIGLQCVEIQPEKRPSIENIVNEINRNHQC